MNEPNIRICRAVIFPPCSDALQSCRPHNWKRNLTYAGFALFQKQRVNRKLVLWCAFRNGQASECLKDVMIGSDYSVLSNYEPSPQYWGKLRRLGRVIPKGDVHRNESNDARLYEWIRFAQAQGTDSTSVQLLRGPLNRSPPVLEMGLPLLQFYRSLPAHTASARTRSRAHLSAQGWCRALTGTGPALRGAFSGTRIGTGQGRMRPYEAGWFLPVFKTAALNRLATHPSGNVYKDINRLSGGTATLVQERGGECKGLAPLFHTAAAP